ncbi:NAD/FAD-dependent oxidoreductase [Thauera propionica]|uniref:NAD/FAD-dependent oxidoreductase n=1 Tax=Thauera propionica TaxID=2019431 RepID=A0A235EZC4_9RHOO|nr:FAD-dependent oxidoreductase [Thauera propionica]OYD54374.1 NAD/FAD-dependent oxidoreductase [Thauera propionica]
MNPNPRYLVIGAGLAGLSAARILREAGFSVTVVDKSRGVGGRMSTRRSDGWVCDHGAQYFTARDAGFRAEVARWQKAGAAALWSPRLVVMDSEGVRAAGERTERFVGVPRMTAPARLLAEGLPVRSGVTVTGLRREGAGWRVVCAEQGELDETFDGVVLAVPAPQAVPLLAPVSPKLATAASRARMEGCWSVMLRFDQALGLPFDAAFVNDGPLRWVARNSGKPGREGQESWLLHASAAWSEANLEADADTVAQALIDAFIALGGELPQSWSAHRWRYAITESAVDGGCLWCPEQGLGLCGDWLNGGRVEGAWLSGRALGREMVRSFQALAR